MDAPIQEAVEMYDRAYSGTGDYPPYSRAPLPPYLECEGSASPGEGEMGVWDTCYHLLALYCRRSHPLETILNPVTSTPSQLDFRLRCALLNILKCLNVFKVPDMYCLITWLLIIVIFLQNNIEYSSTVIFMYSN